MTSRPAAPTRPRLSAGPRAGGVRVGDDRTLVSGRTDRALRLLLVLAEASRHDPEHLVKTEEITRAQGITAKHLERLVGPLRDAGLVTSRRGCDGGYRLTRPPETVTLADVIRVLDGGRGGRVAGRAVDAVEYHGDAVHLRALWSATGAVLDEILGMVSLADVVDGRITVAP